MGAIDKKFEEEEKADRPPPYIIDASALYPLLLRLEDGTSFVKLLPRLRVLDLTKYEIGNAARFDTKIENAASVMGLWEEILRSMGEKRITSLVNVEKIAVQNSITFYDAAYLDAAMNLRSKVVTMDHEILKKFKDNTIDLDSFEPQLKGKKL